MALQKKVGYPSSGLPGDAVNPGQEIYTTLSTVSDGTAAAGGFVFPVAPVASASGQYVPNFVSATGADAAAKPVGFVERNVSSVLATVFDAATTVYPKGTGLNVAIRGAFYATQTADTAPTDGQSVLVADATAPVITYGAAGAAGDTGWKVRLLPGTDGAKGTLVIFENYGVDVAAAAPAANPDSVNKATVNKAQVK